MAKAARRSPDRVEAAGFFMSRAQEAIDAAEAARNEEASAAFYKEAETWLYMASRCLNPEGETARPMTLDVAPPRVRGERRSFMED